MNIKKIAALLIVLSLLFSFIGCKDSKESEGTTTAGKTEETTTAAKMESTTTAGKTESTTAAATTTESKSSLKGPGMEETLEFSVLFDGLMWTKNSRDINESEELDAWSDFTNTKITFITPPSASYNEKLHIMLAGNDLPDVIETNQNTVIADLLEAETIIPLDDLFEKYGMEFVKENEAKGMKKAQISGITYGIPVYATFYAQMGFIARKDWLDTLGMELPTTLDEYVEVLKAFVNNDPNQNGEKDTYGISYRQNFTLAWGFLRSFDLDSNTKITYDYENGKLIPQQTQEKYKNYLAFERQLWEEGVYTPNSMINTSDQWKSELFNGVAGMWYHQTYRVDEYFMKQFRSVKGEDTTVELVALEPPTGYNGEKSSMMNDPVYMTASINKRTEDAESIFNYYMWIFTDDDVREYAKWGIEGIHHTVVDGKKQWIPETMTNDAYNQWKELMYFTSNYPIDDEEIAIRYGEIGPINHKLNAKYGKLNAVDFVGKPTLDAESDYPDIDKLVLEYSTKIISGELELDAGFDEMISRLNGAGLEEVTAARQEWYKSNN